MGTRVKICGNASEDDAREVAALAPDYMGYIFWPGSKRFVKPEAVGAWAKNLPPIPRVGVFVNATPDEVKRAVELAGLSAVQLHGGEDPDHYSGFAKQLWQVIKLRAAELPEIGKVGDEQFQPQEVLPCVDVLLLDTHTAAAPGGTGLTGDWNTARHFVATCKKHVFLAGGLTAENVSDAIRRVQPWGVDVSSGVESSPGKKDLAKVAAFIAAARAI